MLGLGCSIVSIAVRWLPPTQPAGIWADTATWNDDANWSDA